MVDIQREVRKLFKETKLMESVRFESSDGTPLVGVHYVPKKAVRGTVLFVHGLDAHYNIPQYRIFFHLLNHHGIEVYAYDQRGHGQSGGVFDVEKMQEDVPFIFHGLEQRGVREVILATHSIGGIVAAKGLQHANELGVDVPKVRFFVPYAPPRSFTALRKIRLMSKMLGLPAKQEQALGFLRQHVHHNGAAHFRDELQKVADFPAVLRELKDAKLLPKTLTILGSEDEVIETDRPSKLSEYAVELRRSGSNVLKVPFTHEPPLIALNGNRDVFELGKLISKQIERLSRERRKK